MEKKSSEDLKYKNWSVILLIFSLGVSLYSGILSPSCSIINLLCIILATEVGLFTFMFSAFVSLILILISWIFIKKSKYFYFFVFSILVTLLTLLSLSGAISLNAGSV